MMNLGAMPMFPMTHTPNPSRLQNLNRKKNWDDTEDETLARCWLKATETHKSTETKSAEFWRVVTDLFQKATTRDEERSDDACSQRFNNLSKACLKWIMAREAIQQNPMYQTRDEDQLTDVIQEQYKVLMGTDKSFKHFRVLDMLKNNPRWQEHAAALNQRTQSQQAAAKARTPIVGQSKMKLNRDFGYPTADYTRVTQLMQSVQMALSTSLETAAHSNRELGERVASMGAELGKKIDSLGEVLLLKNLPENERKALIDAQLSCRMRALEAQEQEERKRKLQAEIDAIEMENRKRLMLDPTMMTQ